MNTRLQVEHPVTESITGQDLVEWQLRVASGERLPLRQEQLTINGCAMEARLYAENPAKGFLPSTGALERLRFPGGIRIDSGVEEGGSVSPYYDAMIAKLIAHESTRPAVAARLAQACAAVQVWPVRTNAGFLTRVLANQDFVAGELDTGFIERHLDMLVPADGPSPAVLQAAAHAVLQESAAAGTPGPWTALPGFRMAAAPERRVRIEVAGQEHLLELDHATSGAAICRVRDEQVLFLQGEAWPFGVLNARLHARHQAADGALVSPMPGRIASLAVTPGAAVKRGQRLLVLEAMKLEHSLMAPFDGTVAELSVVAGQQVVEGALLLRIVATPKE
jgi:3-methylcrotonyl-CoA carboxylase alpha subunit